MSLSFSSSGGPTASDLQEALEQSKLITVLITENALQLPSLIHAMEAAKSFNTIVVHHYEKRNPFPKVKDLPETIQQLFHEKAITYLPEYSNVVAKRIQSNVLEMQEGAKKAKQTKKASDIHTDLFLWYV